jgi:hypothetical protein
MVNDSFLQAHMDKEIKDSFSINYLSNQTFDDLSVCRINYHRIFMLKEGNGTLLIDDVAYQLSGSELFLLAKGQLYAFHPNTRITGYELSFGDCFWEKAPDSANNCKAVLFNNAAANQQLPLNRNDHSELDMLFHALYLEFTKNDYLTANK